MPPPITVTPSVSSPAPGLGVAGVVIATVPAAFVQGHSYGVNLNSGTMFGDSIAVMPGGRSISRGASLTLLPGHASSQQHLTASDPVSGSFFSGRSAVAVESNQLSSNNQITTFLPNGSTVNAGQSASVSVSGTGVTASSNLGGNLGNLVSANATTMVTTNGAMGTVSSQNTVDIPVGGRFGTDMSAITVLGVPIPRSAGVTLFGRRFGF